MPLKSNLNCFGNCSKIQARTKLQAYNFIALRPCCRYTHKQLFTLSAGGWWWTENKAPMMMSPGMCATTLRSLESAPSHHTQTDKNSRSDSIIMVQRGNEAQAALRLYVHKCHKVLVFVEQLGWPSQELMAQWKAWNKTHLSIIHFQLAFQGIFVCQGGSISGTAETVASMQPGRFRRESDKDFTDGWNNSTIPQLPGWDGFHWNRSMNDMFPESCGKKELN